MRLILVLAVVAMVGCSSQLPIPGSSGSGSSTGVIDQATLNTIEQLALQYAIAQLSQSAATSKIQQAYPTVPVSTIQPIVVQQFKKAKQSKPSPTPKPKPKT